MRQSTDCASAKPALILFMVFTMAATTTRAQSRIGYISISELIQAMPEYKKADSSLTNYQNALTERYQEMEKELQAKDSVLSSPDAAHQTREVIEVKKKAA